MLCLSQLKQWTREYSTLRGIPSTTGTAPSRVFPWFEDVLNELHIPFQGIFVDLGCGKGRNTVYCAQKGCFVVGVDIVEEALHGVFARQKEQDDLRIALVQNSIETVLPFRNNVFDGACDITAMDNILQAGGHRFYAGEIHRILKTSGIVLLYFFDPDDGYYRRYITSHEGSFSLVHDPHNNIRSALFNERYIMNLFAPLFSVVARKDFTFDDRMYAGTYTRSLHGIILEKK